MDYWNKHKNIIKIGRTAKQTKPSKNISQNVKDMNLQPADKQLLYIVK